jgi:hypothetical protein
VFIYALTYKKLLLAVVPGAVHLTAALLTLINFTDDGCYSTIPIILALGICMAILAIIVTWRVGPQ